MKAIKIEIDKEYIDLPKDVPILRSVTADGRDLFNPVIAEEGKYPQLGTVTVHETVYKKVQIMNPDSKSRKPEVYFVKTEDDGLFRALVEARDDLIEQKMQKCVSEGYKEGIKEGRDLGKRDGIVTEYNRIKLLPWYKRIFL